MIDGAAWLKQLEAEPATLVLLPHDEAVELARSLATAQACASDAIAAVDRADRERRILGAIVGTAGIAGVSTPAS